MNRLRAELKESLKSTSMDVQLHPVSESSLYRWNAIITGPKDSPYQDGQFRLSISIPQDYPLSPPTISFVTPIFHPNVNFKTGEICLDILKEQWTPVWSLSTACLAIVALLSHPAADSPLNCDAGNLIRAGDDVGFRSMASMYTIEFAINKMEK